VVRVGTNRPHPFTFSALMTQFDAKTRVRLLFFRMELLYATGTLARSFDRDRCGYTPLCLLPMAEHRTIVGEPQVPKGGLMLYYAIVFLIIALIAGLLGFGFVAFAAAGIAKILFFVFLIMFIVSLIMHAGRRRSV
jgi:uncharacterized membrane protein YtjA (UPF0391 family)